MRKLTKFISLALAAGMTLTACGAADTTETAPASSAAKEETKVEASKEEAPAAPAEIVDITVMVYDRGHEYENGNTLTDNEFTRWMNRWNHLVFM